MELLRKMEEEKADIILNDIVSSSYPVDDNRLEKSAPLFWNELIWILPQKMPIPTWSIFMHLFSVAHWLQLLIAYLMLLTIWSFSRNSSFLSAFLAITRLFLLQNVNNANTLSKRVILATGSFLIVHFSVFFTSQLISMLMNPYGASTITTLDELARMKVSFTYDDHISDLLKSTNHNTWQQLEAKRKGPRGKMDHEQFINFLSHSLNDSYVIFSTEFMLLYYYVRNLEEIETHPIKVSD